MLRVGAHGGPHLVSHGPHAVAVRTEHAELHREAHRRTEVQPVDPEARLGDDVVGNQPFEAGLEPLARLRPLGHHDDEREVLVRQHGIERQEESRRAFADIGRVVLEVRVALDERFRLLCRRFGDTNGGAFRQADLDEELRPRRRREELLLNLRERGDSRAESPKRQRDDHPAVAHRPADDAAQGAIEARLVEIVRRRAPRGAS